MEIIALSGYARSGKDEAANVLINDFGFTRVAFADKLRDVLYQLNPIVTQTSRKLRLTPDSDEISLVKNSFVQDVIDEHGWEGYKSTPYGTEIRRLLQRLGTEAGRQTMWDSIWIDAAFANVDEDAKVVVTDCRFPNEAQAVKDRGGRVLRISRAGVGPAVTEDGKIHASETSLDNWAFDYQLFNNGTLEEYQNEIRELVQGWEEDASRV